MSHLTMGRFNFDGVLFVNRGPHATTFHRFDEATLSSPDTHFDRDRAAPAAGALIRFTTGSNHIVAAFRIQPGEDRGADFGIFRNGLLVEEKHFDKTATDLSFSLEARQARPASYEISLPSWASVGFLGLDLDEGQNLLPNPARKRKVYAAIGDSITHGTGQESASYKTYPFQLARLNGWELFNLAVGAGKTSPSIGSLLADKPVDVVTILFGYNDWNTHANVAIYSRDYSLLLDRLRAAHPKLEIYCLTNTNTKSIISRTKLPVPLEAFRDVVRRLVNERIGGGDGYVHLIEGPMLVALSDLRDAVHLNIAGAEKMAAALAKAIRPLD